MSTETQRHSSGLQDIHSIFEGFPEACPHENLGSRMGAGVDWRRFFCWWTTDGEPCYEVTAYWWHGYPTLRWGPWIILEIGFFSDPYLIDNIGCYLPRSSSRRLLLKMQEPTDPSGQAASAADVGPDSDVLHSDVHSILCAKKEGSTKPGRYRQCFSRLPQR